jgi:hypothetical protein
LCPAPLFFFSPYPFKALLCSVRKREKKEGEEEGEEERRRQEYEQCVKRKCKDKHIIINDSFLNNPCSSEIV